MQLGRQLFPVVLGAALLFLGMHIQDACWSGVGVRIRPPQHVGTLSSDPLLALGALEYTALLGKIAHQPDVEAVRAAPQLAHVLADLELWMPMELGKPWWTLRDLTPGSVFAALFLSVPIFHSALARQQTLIESGEPVMPGILPAITACGNGLLALGLLYLGIAVKSWLLAGRIVAPNAPVWAAYLEGK